MAKWDFLRDKFSKVPVEANYLQKVDAILDAEVQSGPDEFDRVKVRDLPDFEIKNRYVKVRDEIDELEAKIKALKTEQEAYTRLFVDRMEDEGEASKTFSDGISIGVTVEPYPFVTGPAALVEWVKDRGMESMLTLNYQTMASLVKERLEGKVNEPLPPGVDVYMKDKLTVRGRRK